MEKWTKEEINYMDSALPDFWKIIQGKYWEHFYAAVATMSFMESFFVQDYAIKLYERADFKMMALLTRFRFLSFAGNTDFFIEACKKSNSFGEFFEKCEDAGLVDTNENSKIKEEVDIRRKREEKTVNIFYDDIEGKLLPFNQRAIFCFTQNDEQSLYYIYIDFIQKSKSVYNSIIRSDSIKEYNKEIIKDYLCLVESILMGNYIIEEKKVSLKNAREYDRVNDIIEVDGGGFYDKGVSEETLEKLFCECFSERTTFILYNAWRIDKTVDNFKRYLVSLCVRTKIICDEKRLNIRYTNGDEDIIDLLKKLYEYDDIIKLENKDIVNMIVSYNDCQLCKANDRINKTTKALEDYKDTISIERWNNVFCKEFEGTEYRIDSLVEENLWDLYTLIDRVARYSNGIGRRYMYPKSEQRLLEDGWISNFVSDFYFPGVDETIFNKNKSFTEFCKTIHYMCEHSEESWLNNLDSNMNFDPYTDRFQQIDMEEFFLEKVENIDRELRKLAFCLRDLYLLKFAIDSSDYEDLFDIELDETIARIKSRVYGAKNGRKVYSEIEKLSIKELEEKDTTHSEDINIQHIFAFIEEMISSKNIDDLISKRMKFAEYISNFDNKDVLLQNIEHISNKIADGMTNIVRTSDKFKIEEKDVFNRLHHAFSELEKKAKVLYGAKYNEESFKSVFKKIGYYVITGEILRNDYVINESAVEIVDYGCIALEYYKALENLVNYMFYEPYYKNVLSQRQCDKTKDVGYVGNSFNQISKKKCYKQSLEYGTISRFFENIDSNQKEYLYMQAFFQERDVNIKRMAQYFKKMSKTSRLRNDCAHPQITDKKYVDGARNIVYFKSNTNIDEVQGVFELILECASLFG